MVVVRLFFGNRSFTLLFLPIIIGVFFLLNHYLHHHTPEVYANFGFWGRVANQDQIGFELGALVLIFINGVLINTVFNRNEFMEKNSFLTSMLYVSFLSFFHSFYYLDGLAIAQTLVILFLLQLVKLRQNEDGRRAVFNSSFLFGLACSFYPVLLIGIPFVFWMIWVVRPFIFRESVLIISGLMIPLVYGGLFSFFFQIELDRTQFSSSSSENNLMDLLILTSGAILLFLIAIKPLFNKIDASTIRLKKLFRILLLFLFLSFCLVLLEFFVFNKSDALSLSIIPLVIFLPYAFGIKQLRKPPTFVFYLILFYAVSKFFIPFGDLAF